MRSTILSTMRSLASAVLLISSALAQAPQQVPAQAKQAPEVPYLPTTQVAVEAMLKLAGVTANDVVYDLGCGDGRIVVTAAKLYGARGVGIDIDPQRIREANENAKKSGVERLVRFEENDLFKANIREASVVTLFLLTSVNARLRPKLLQELRPGTRVVSNTFDMGDWKPEKEFTVDTGDEGYFSRKLYLWTIPPRSNK
jgi:SAM-dependent methyltransferase